MRNVFSTRVILRDEIRLCFYFFVVCESCAVEIICITTNCKYPRHVRCVVISSLVHKYQRFNSFKQHPLFSLFTREALLAGSLQLFWPDFCFLLVFYFVCLFGYFLFSFFFPTPSLFVLHTFVFFLLQTKTMEPWAKLIPNPSCTPSPPPAGFFFFFF